MWAAVFFYTAFAGLLLFISLCVSPGLANGPRTINLPVPGKRVNTSDVFVPVLLKGMTIHPDQPFLFDFIVDGGDTNFSSAELKNEVERLVKYFLASMTVPKDDLWVNLSPYEEDHIIPDELGKTELGRDLLAQDYLLKQITASLMYPENELGETFWDKIYQEMQDRFGTINIPIDTFNKVWIIPESARVYEHEQTVYVVGGRLKVMLEEDYFAMRHNHIPDIAEEDDSFGVPDKIKGETVPIQKIVREIILPQLEREVNEGKNFAPLRQIYHSLILAKWYKETITNSLLSKIYADKSLTEGVESAEKEVKARIYAQYMEAYKKGVFNYIKPDYDRLSQKVIPRKYFSGGVLLGVGDISRTSSPVKESSGPKYTAQVEVLPQKIKRSGSVDFKRRVVIDKDFVVQKDIRKILVVAPFPYDEIPFSSRYRNRFPLGAGYIAASIAHVLGGENVYFLDLSVVDDDFDYDAYLRKNNFDMIAFSIPADALIDITADLAKRARQVLPAVVIVAGGVPVSENPEKILKKEDQPFDIGVRGEGEIIIREVIDFINHRKSLRDVPGIMVFNSDNDRLMTQPAPLPNLDDMVHPPWDFIDLSRYDLDVPFMDGPTVNIISSRGCPFKCAHCAYKAVSGSRIRFRSAENVFAEMEGYYLQYGVTSFYFVDDFFAFDIERLKKLSHMIIESGYPFAWRIQTRADGGISDPEILALIKKAGCNHLSFGIESGDPRVLKAIDKRLNLDTARRTIKMAKDMGLRTRLFFMVGLPEQDWASVRLTEQFIRDVGADEVSVKILVPFEGSPIGKDPESYGIHLLDIPETMRLMIHDNFHKATDPESTERAIPATLESEWLSAEDIYKAKWYLTEVAAGAPVLSNADGPRKLADWFVNQISGRTLRRDEYQTKVNYIMLQLKETAEEKREAFFNILWDALIKHSKVQDLPESDKDSDVLIFDYNTSDQIDLRMDENGEMHLVNLISGNPANVYTALAGFGKKANYVAYPDRESARRAILLDSGREILITSPAKKDPPGSQPVFEKVRNALSQMKAGSIFIVSGSMHPEISGDALARLLGMARERNVFVLADSSLKLTRDQVTPLLRYSNLISPNLKEFENILRLTDIVESGKELNAESEQGRGEILYFAGLLSKKFGVSEIIVTLGNSGVLFYSPRGSYYGKTEVPPALINSHFGLGDAFLSGIVLKLSQSNSAQPDNSINWLDIFAFGLQTAAAKLKLPGLAMPDVVQVMNERQHLSLELVERGLLPEREGAAEAPSDSAKGGIDFNKVEFARQGLGVDINFDLNQVRETVDRGIAGFAPEIINLSPLPSVLPLLGLVPQGPQKEEEFEFLSSN